MNLYLYMVKPFQDFPSELPEGESFRLLSTRSDLFGGCFVIQLQDEYWGLERLTDEQQSILGTPEDIQNSVADWQVVQHG
jgi:hypothetical protein